MGRKRHDFREYLALGESHDVIWMRKLAEIRPPGGDSDNPPRTSTPLRLLKGESGINGLLPTFVGPLHLFRFSLDQASLRAGKVTVFCVRQLCARSSLRLSTAKPRCLGRQAGTPKLPTQNSQGSLLFKYSMGVWATSPLEGQAGV
jgi:hypothetical protein